MRFNNVCYLFIWPHIVKSLYLCHFRQTYGNKSLKMHDQHTLLGFIIGKYFLKGYLHVVNKLFLKIAITITIRINIKMSFILLFSRIYILSYILVGNTHHLLCLQNVKQQQMRTDKIFLFSVVSCPDILLNKIIFVVYATLVQNWFSFKIYSH